MCIGLDKQHPDCGHISQFAVTIPCDLAVMNGPGGECSRVECTRVDTIYVSPPLCVTCYRQTEEDMFESANKQIRQVTIRINDINHDLECLDEITDLKKDYLEGIIEEAEECISRIREQLTAQLRSFRSAQGVWGDG